MNSWDDLSIREKAEMMKVAIRNGITSLPDIKDAYNEFAEGGNLYGDGSYLSKAKSLIKRHEGWRSTPYKDAPKGKSWRSVGYGFNDSGFYEKYPEGISKHYEKGITKAQAEQELDYYLGKAERTLRGIYGKHWDSFNDNQKAAIFDTYYQRPASVGKGSAFYNAVKSGRDATKYLSVSGYAGRNKDRQSVFGGGATPAVAEDIEVTLPQEMTSQPMIAAIPDFTPMNPHVFGMQMPSYQSPVVVPEQPIIVMAEQPTPTPEQLERQRIIQEREEQRDALNRFGLLMSMSNPQQGNDMMGAIGMLAGLSNDYRSGGDIHIKPSHRGRFTELKERTGHSASWFKEHGTPAQKKMATFALNAAKWKHGYGGNLYDGTSQPTQQMDNSYTYYKPLENIFVDSEGNLRDPEVPRARGSFLLPEVTAAYPDLKDMVGRYNIVSNDATTVANGRPVNMHLRKAVDEGAKKQAAWAQEHPYLNMAGLAAGAAPLVVATTPAVVGGGELAATALANPYVDKGIVSAFAGHGLNHAINEGINGYGDAFMTALELTPLGRVARPVYEGIVQPGMRLFNSPLTGNWTRINNGEYRLSPNSLGDNGALLESRVVNSQDDVTDNLLKWLGRPEGYKPEKPISQMDDLYFDFKPVQREMADIWKDKGVNLDRISGNDIEEALKKRWDELVSSRQDRHTIVRSVGNDTYFLHDLMPDKKAPYGWRSIGTTQLNKDASGNMHMVDINNNTGSVRAGKPATEHGVQEKALNAAIKVAKQEGGDGVVTGEQWLSAPKQQHVVQKYHDREVVGNTGQHSNANMVEERINADIRRGLPVTGEEETLAKSMLDLRRADNKEIKTLLNQPFWLLRTPTKDVPVKSTLFDPTIIDRFGRMHIDWNDPNIFRGIASPTLIGAGLYGTQE